MSLSMNMLLRSPVSGLLRVSLLLLFFSGCQAGLMAAHTQKKKSGERFQATPFQLWYPDSIGPNDKIRSVYFDVKPQGYKSLKSTTDPARQKLCAAEDCAILGAQLNDRDMSRGIGVSRSP